MCKVKNCCDCLFLELGDMVPKCRHPKGKAIQMDPFFLEEKGECERHPECPKMIEFPSLEEFLLLGDEFDGRSIHDNMSARDYVAQYHKAKASWEKYGDMPPIGSKVRTLDGGHGNYYSGRIRIFSGIYNESREFLMFRLERLKERNNNTCSLVFASQWWNEIEVIEDGEE